MKCLKDLLSSSPRLLPSDALRIIQRSRSLTPALAFLQSASSLLVYLSSPDASFNASISVIHSGQSEAYAAKRRNTDTSRRQTRQTRSTECYEAFCVCFALSGFQGS
ncbi:hypothetical protein QQF64_031598 [Cirrhinus molitorella]|uniref:Uncharacterized protein n=1 Tax=Cirrhinus molitorella TaxID=172907 RepID=A0ABR3MXG3_9TELE